MTELVPVPSVAPVRSRRTRLSDSARRRLQGSVSGETLRAYKREGGRFAAWCQERGEVWQAADSDLLANWVAGRCDAGHSPEAIAQGISGVLFFQDQGGYPETDAEDAWRIVGAYRRERVDAGFRPTRAAVLTGEEVRRMYAALPEGKLSTVRDRAILLLGLFMYGRRSAIVRLDVADVAFDRKGGIRLRITRSKTDQQARGKTKVIQPGRYEASDAVAALRAWVEALAAQGITSGPLFRRISYAGRILPHRLNPAWVNVLVKRCARAAGLEERPGEPFRAHSLRATAATLAAGAGASLLEICEEGDWSPTSPAVHVYIRPEQSKSALGRADL